MNRFRAHAALAGAAALSMLVALAGCGSSGGQASSSPMPTSSAAAMNPNLDPGSSLGGVSAPDFRLLNQFGQPMSLNQFRGKVVVLSFQDSECTTVCPLTAQSMLLAKQMLGSAGSRVQLLGVDANPDATSVADVLAYSRAHGMVNQWAALDTTGRVADGYGVQDQPWFALVSASGKTLWSHDGWLSLSALESAVRHAVSR
jgi:cytochrome oxidase Cu insertion factor (SCO1/SenC/PrrC family)